MDPPSELYRSHTRFLYILVAYDTCSSCYVTDHPLHDRSLPEEDQPQWNLLPAVPLTLQIRGIGDGCALLVLL